MNDSVEKIVAEIRDCAHNHETPRGLRDNYMLKWADRLAALESAEPVYVIFDGPPSHESGRFVEVENDRRQSLKAGEWDRRDDNLWRLGPFYLHPDTRGADAGRWQFFREHFHSSIEGYALNDWIGCRTLKYGGVDATIDAAIAIHDAALSKAGGQT